MLRDDAPIYNLMAVVQETGIKPDTLRAWERRYGLPNPQRTDGGHRLYSRHDISTIQWLIAQRESGLSISKAVELWKQLEADAAAAPQLDNQLDQESVDESESNVARHRNAWIAACLKFDENTARQVMFEAFALFSVERVCLEILLPGVRDIGRRWYGGSVTVQQEHFATNLASRQMESLIALVPPPVFPERILVAAPPHEDHVFSLLLLTLLLRRRGRDVVYLGADVPIEDTAETVRTGDFQLVVSAAQTLTTAASLREMAAELRVTDVTFVYGGLIFNQLPSSRSRIYGKFLGEDLAMAPQTIESILVAEPSEIEIEPVQEKFAIARGHYQDRVYDIDQTVVASLAGSGIPHEQVLLANENMEHSISAALSLGDINYLGHDIAWTDGLLTNHGVPEGALERYLTEYRRALKQHLDGPGEPILAWAEDGK